MKSQKTFLKIILISICIVIISGGLLCCYVLFTPNVVLQKKEAIIYVYPNDSFNDVLNQLKEKKTLKNIQSFKWLARIMDYPGNIKTGRYPLKAGYSNLKLLHDLKSGRQTPGKLTFNNIRTKEQLAKRLGEQLMIDSLEIITMLNDIDFLNGYELTGETVPVIFIPNTYDVYWDITASALFEKMWNEYNHFWTEERRSKAAEVGFSLMEISTLASIVEEETNYSKEKPTIAGLYINRLKMGMPLQADPTVKFALGNFSIKRVLREQLKFDSPYNTYIYTGLPPGPIRIPSIQSIDAVLNYEDHNYIYMCAKYDLSGSHDFSTNYKGHQQNAEKYRRALNKQKIYN